MEPSELVKVVAGVCEQIGIPYRTVGSVASSLYGEPRHTVDVDILVRLESKHVDAFCAEFAPPDYYCSLDAARDAVVTRFQFNILHLTSGLKADIIVADELDFDRSLFVRGQSLTVDGSTLWVASPEDVIIKKLEYFKLGGSEKHLRDIVGILKVQAEAIDRAYLVQWIDKLELATEWALVEGRLGNGAKP